jgi:hypothetical protein
VRGCWTPLLLLLLRELLVGVDALTATRHSFFLCCNHHIASLPGLKLQVAIISTFVYFYVYTSLKVRGALRCR